MTNREWLKSLNNEELSYILGKSLLNDITFYGCGYCPYCNKKADSLADCESCILYWLKQEHKEDSEKC